MRCRIATLFLIAVSASSVRAEVPELSPTVVETEPPVETELATGVASIVALDDQPAASATLADTLATLPGLQVRHAGGPESFAALSIRGVGPQNVAVVLDDLPLSSATLGPVDLSLYPPESLARLEVWRGAGPVRFPSPLGGVLHLVTHTASDRTELSAHASYGSFGTTRAHLRLSGPAGDLRYVAYVGRQASRGDFVFYDDRDTPYNPDDDGLERRRNNASDAWLMRLKAEVDGPLRGVVKMLVGGVWRDQGVPGPGVAQSRDSHASQAEGLVRGSVSDMLLVGERLRLGIGSDLLVSTRRFRDPDQQVGLRIEGATSHLQQIGVDVRAEILATASQETEISPRLQWDRFRQQTAQSSAALDTISFDRDRLSAGVGVEHRLDLFAGLRLVPSIRLDIVRDSGAQAAPRPVQQTSPRLGLLWTLHGCAIRTNVGRFHRFPTLLERYGDLVTSVGNPEVSPERGLMTDLGADCVFRPPLLRQLSVDAHGFGHDGKDLIVVTQNSQRWLRAENLGHVRTYGVETTAALQHAWAGVTASYTWTRAREIAAAAWANGKEVPGIPRHRLTTLVRLGPDWLSVDYELSVTSLTYLARGNERPIPRRLLHNLSLTGRHAATGLQLSLWVRNLLNQRSETMPLPGGLEAEAPLADFIGYPIPGRSVFAGLTWRTP